MRKLFHDRISLESRALVDSALPLQNIRTDWEMDSDKQNGISTHTCLPTHMFAHTRTRAQINQPKNTGTATMATDIKLK